MDVHPTKNVSIGIDPYPNQNSALQLKLKAFRVSSINHNHRLTPAPNPRIFFSDELQDVNIPTIIGFLGADAEAMITSLRGGYLKAPINGGFTKGWRWNPAFRDEGHDLS
jgi:hypothetical protein